MKNMLTSQLALSVTLNHKIHWILYLLCCFWTTQLSLALNWLLCQLQILIQTPTVPPSRENNKRVVLFLFLIPSPTPGQTVQEKNGTSSSLSSICHGVHGVAFMFLFILWIHLSKSNCIFLCIYLDDLHLYLYSTAHILQSSHCLFMPKRVIKEFK